MGWMSTLSGHHEHVHAIGMISIEHGNMEIFLGRLFSEILDVASDVGQGVFWCAQSAALRRDMVKTAAEQTFRPRFPKPSLMVEEEANAENKLVLEAIENVLDRAKRLTGQRNDKIIHSLWATDNETGKAIRATSKTFTTDEMPKTVPIEELNKLTSDLRLLIDEIQSVIKIVKKAQFAAKWWLHPKNCHGYGSE